MGVEYLCAIMTFSVYMYILLVIVSHKISTLEYGVIEILKNAFVILVIGFYFIPAIYFFLSKILERKVIDEAKILVVYSFLFSLSYIALCIIFRLKIYVEKDLVGNRGLPFITVPNLFFTLNILWSIGFHFVLGKDDPDIVSGRITIPDFFVLSTILISFLLSFVILWIPRKELMIENCS